MENSYKYQVSAAWALHHRGIVKMENAVPEVLDFSVPPEFGGVEGLWTPEHLLLASVASCFVATFRGMAEKSNLGFETVDVTAEGIIEKQEGKLRFTQIFLRAEVAIRQDLDRERTGRLLEKAEHVCLIANSLSCKLVLHPVILVEAPLPV